MGKAAIAEGLPVYAISNTVFDRLRGIRGAKRISATQGERLPEKLIKQALRNVHGIRDGFGVFREIGRVLDYCGYERTVGMRIRSRLKAWPVDLHERLAEMKLPPEVTKRLVEVTEMFFHRALPDIEWLHFEGLSYEISRSYDLTEIVFWERELKQLGIIRAIDLFLRKDQMVMPIANASSGQLSMISTLVFLSSEIDEGRGWVLIDEPENSLHPQWQKEYVTRLSKVIHYRSIKVMIATHAPVLVSGATLGPVDVDIIHLQDGEPTGLVFDRVAKKTESVEQVLWDVFDTITPANHFVSSKLVEEIERVEEGKTSAESVGELIGRMQSGSYDDKQRAFFNDVSELARRVEERRGQFGLTEGDDE